MVERGGTLVVGRVPARNRGESGGARSPMFSVPRGEQLWSATIEGEPAPQARQHDVVLTDGVARLVTSRPARLWQNRAVPQLLNRRPARPLARALVLDCGFWSSTPRSPVGESLVIEVLERAAIIAHGSQIREKRVFAAIDRDKPRVTVCLTPSESQP